MLARTVAMTSTNGDIGIVPISAAAGIISELTGADEHEIARDLTHGISFGVGALSFVPDVVDDLARGERTTRPLSPVERAPFPAGRKG